MLCSQMTTWMHLQSHLSDMRASQNRPPILLYAIRTTRAIYYMKLLSSKAHTNRPSSRPFHSTASTSPIRPYPYCPSRQEHPIILVSHHLHLRFLLHIHISFTSYGKQISVSVRQKATNSIHVFPTRVKSINDTTMTTSLTTGAARIRVCRSYLPRLPTRPSSEHENSVAAWEIFAALLPVPC
jgi:hypothetical protein